MNKSVGRYKQKQVYVREFKDVIVVLLNQETIYSMPKQGSPNIIYHRFFGPLGTYPEWKRFRHSMRYNRRLNPKTIHTIAIRNNIQSFGTMRTPNLKNKTVSYEVITAQKRLKQKKRRQKCNF